MIYNTKRPLIDTTVRSPAGAGFSVDLDGSTEYYESAETSWGFGNAWSVGVWASPDSGIAGQLVSLRKASTNHSFILLDQATSTNFETWAGDTSGNNLKRYRWTSPSAGAWRHLVLTWDGSDLLLYIDSVLTAPDSKLIDNSGSMGDAVDRQLNYGSNKSGADNFQGLVGHLGFWDTPLTQASVSEIYNPFAGLRPFGLDLTQDRGGYTQSSDLIHYYRPGFAGPGTDVGDTDEVGSNDLTAVNVTAADIVEDAPL